MFKITGVRLTLYPQRNYKTSIIVLGVVSLLISKPSIVILWKSVTMNQFLSFFLKVILFIPIQYSFQLHYGNVTYHSRLYSWKGSTCNYLVSYEQYDGISYEYVLCFFSTNNKCSRVLHKLICVNQFLITHINMLLLLKMLQVKCMLWLNVYRLDLSRLIVLMFVQ